MFAHIGGQSEVIALYGANEWSSAESQIMVQSVFH
jgi:hypothetical protein